MEPIFFEPIYKNVIWGGNNISKIFKRNIIGDNIGESWELSAHKNGLSIIANGEFKGRSLDNLFNDKEQKHKVFGMHCENLNKFPILAKFIDANKSLSIQVHPGNEYAKKYENDSGKTEVWYVMDCKDDAKIIYGFNDNVNNDNIKFAMGNIEKNVNYIDVHKGDFIEIPSGTIHAIMDGVFICEIQQNSDVTYRVYDWNRVDSSGKSRELHTEKALDVINLNSKKEIYNYDLIKKDTSMYKSDIFNIDMVNINGNKEEISSKESFLEYIVIEGKRRNKNREFLKRNKKRRHIPNSIKFRKIYFVRRIKAYESLDLK